MTRRPILRPLALVVGALAAVGLWLPVPGAAQVTSTAATVTEADPLEVTRDLIYGAAPNEDGEPEILRLDVYDPGGTARARPLVVLIHGGGYTQGDKADPVYVATAERFARQGYVVASVNYRLQDDTFPLFPVASLHAQHDVQAAVRWMRARAEQWRIDPARIAVTGHSAGAMTALRVATNPHDPGESGTPGESSEVAAVLAVSGFLPGAVQAADARVVMLHGTADTMIPLSWATDTCKRWREVGGDCVVAPVEGGSHDATDFLDRAPVVVHDFLRCTVGGPVSFDDVPAGTATSTAVGWATGRGIVNGSVTGRFGVAAPMTRGRFATWAWRLVGRPVTAAVTFTDVAPRSPTAPAASWAVESGTLRRGADGRFRAAETMTRSAAAVALWRLAGRPEAVGPVSRMGSAIDPSARYARAVRWLDAAGMAEALGGHPFRAYMPLTRTGLTHLLRGLSFDREIWAEAPDTPLCF